MTKTPQYIDRNGRYYVLLDDEAGHQLLDSFVLADYATKDALTQAIEARAVHFAEHISSEPAKLTAEDFPDVAVVDEPAP